MRGNGRDCSMMRSVRCWGVIEMATGHEQIQRMAGLGKDKVDKSIRPPVGFGVVDHVFHRFDQRWRDEWKRLMCSQAGCEALAGEWQRELYLFDEAAVRAAVVRCLENTVPPTLVRFVSVVQLVREERKPKPVNRELGLRSLSEIKRMVGQ